jgi:transcriptional regulator with XRE-family HTH domain
VPAEVPRWVFSPDALYALRVRAGLSQLALAKRAGTSQATISHWETGHVRPQIDLFLALVRALACEVTDLLVDLDADAALTDNEAPNGTSVPDESRQVGSSVYE